LIQAERILHEEVMLRLQSLRPRCVVVPIPNGAWFPARTPSERSLIARLVARMKAEGQMLPGAADLLCLWEDGSGAIELKRPAEHSLLGKRPAGRPSDAQKEFAALCAMHGVRHVYATSWDEVHAALADWERLL
jgi:hypothetical protein